MFKTKIKIRTICGTKPTIINQGDWIDLRLAEDYELTKGEYKLLKLNVAIELPKGFEAIAVSRSSTPKNFSIMMANSQGIIDETYNGNDDIWRFPAFAFRKTKLQADERICQFRIQPSQKASIWTKIKWLFSSGVEIVHVDKLEGNNRGGIGTTGKK